MEMADDNDKSIESPSVSAGAPAADSVVRAPVERVLANTMPEPIITNMEGGPVDLDAKLAAKRPSCWDWLWAKTLGAAIIPENPGGKVDP